MRSHGFRAAVSAILSAGLSYFRSLCLSLSLCLSAGGALVGCVNDGDRTAGVDEFPNSIYARVNGFLEEGKQAEAIHPVPAFADSLLAPPAIRIIASAPAAPKLAADALRGAPTPPLRRLAKSGAKADADSGCTGILTFTDTIRVPAENPLKVTVNSASICLDAFFLDTIKGNETILSAKFVSTYAGGRVETAVITDGDGDGRLNPADEYSRENILFTAAENGVTEKTEILVGAGPDLDFNGEADNRLYAIAWSKVSGSDTLGTAVYTDADGDGVAIDNSKASLVDLDFYQRGPSADHPDAVWSRAKLRLVVRYQEEAKEVKRVRFEMEDSTGRREIGEVLDRSGAADFDMRDTVQAHFLTHATAGSDTLDSLDVRLTMGLGRDFDAKSDDSIYAMDMRSAKKLGEEKSAHFAFRSDKPIPSGKDPVSGELSMEVEYADGTSLSVEGMISADRLDVTVRDRQGKRVHAVWDRQGRGISVEEVK
ncbi:MAG: hypothetical protein ABI036_03210 [Fibrobacteria bacterium]